MKQSFIFLLFTLLTLLGSAQRTEDDYRSSAPASAQPKPKVPFRDRLTFGGGLGASFGIITFIQIAPQVGYRTTERWVNGIGVNYMYFNTQGRSQSIYGASVWSRFFVADGLFLTTEYEMLNREAFTPELGFQRRNVPIWLVGGGYFTGGKALRVGIQLLYDLIGDPLSPYGNPVIRGGMMIGI